MSEEKETFPLIEQFPQLFKRRMLDRIPPAFILTRAITKVQDSFLTGDQYIVEEAIMGLEDLIDSERLRDEKYEDEVQNCTYSTTVDVRPKDCGVRLSKEFCKEHGIAITAEMDQSDPHMRLHAAINLFSRRGMLSKMPLKDILFREKEMEDILEEEL